MSDYERAVWAHREKWRGDDGLCGARSPGELSLWRSSLSATAELQAWLRDSGCSYEHLSAAFVLSPPAQRLFVAAARAGASASEMRLISTAMRELQNSGRLDLSRLELELSSGLKALRNCLDAESSRIDSPETPGSPADDTAAQGAVPDRDRRSTAWPRCVLVERAAVDRMSAAAIPFGAREFDSRTCLPATPIAAQKRELVLAVQKGPFVRALQRDYYRGRDVGLLELGEGCPMDCVYCYLQTYLRSQRPVAFVNFADCTPAIMGAPHDLLCTGMLSDSLVLDRFLRFIEFLEDLPAGRGPSVEARTKSPDVGHLQPARARRVILSWSLSPEEIVAQYEFGAASLTQRLDAARHAWGLGYRIAFHLDPVLLVDGWARLYAGVIERLLGLSFRPEYVTIGSLKLEPKLRTAIGRRFPRRTGFLRALELCADGKYRYAGPMREAMYAALRRPLAAAGIPILLSMEPC
ncbi:MAG: spore photoproduct lyase family protein [Acidobacteriota bacterium]